MKRQGNKIYTLAEVQAADPILRQGESILVDTGTEIQQWVGLDGVSVNSVYEGTPWSQLPARHKINETPTANSANIIIKHYDVEEEEYVAPELQTTIFVGAVDPGPSGLNVASDNDIWYEELAILPPSNLQSSIVTLNTVRLTWTDNSDNEDGFIVAKSDAYLDWDLDVSDGDSITSGTKVSKEGAIYVCGTTHDVGTPKEFILGNYTASFLAFTDVNLSNGVTVGPDVTTYDVTGNAYDSRFMFKVTAKQGSNLSAANPVVSAKTDALGEEEDTQTDFIVGLTDMWAMWRGYDAGSPLSDHTGNNRTVAAQGTGTPTYQQSALETTDGTPYSILVRQDGASWFLLSSIWGFSNQSWEISYFFKLHPSFGVPGNGPFFGLWTDGQATNGRIALWTDSTATKFQIQTITDAGVWGGQVGTFTYQKGVTYMVNLAYNHATATLALYINGSGTADATYVKNLSSGFSCNRFGINRNSGGGLNQYFQKFSVRVGSIWTAQERADAYAKGTYA
jgi:hypothetical protein